MAKPTEHHTEEALPWPLRAVQGAVARVRPGCRARTGRLRSQRDPRRSAAGRDAHHTTPGL